MENTRVVPYFYFNFRGNFDWSAGLLFLLGELPGDSSLRLSQRDMHQPLRQSCSCAVYKARCTWQLCRTDSGEGRPETLSQTLRVHWPASPWEREAGQLAFALRAQHGAWHSGGMDTHWVSWQLCPQDTHTYWAIAYVLWASPGWLGVPDVSRAEMD